MVSEGNSVAISHSISVFLKIFSKTLPSNTLFMEEKCPNSLLDIICKLGDSGLILLLNSTEQSSAAT